jgi:hypothetical protein
LDTSTIDKNVKLAVHYVESFLEDVFYGLEIIEIAVNNVCGGSERANSIQGFKVG